MTNHYRYIINIPDGMVIADTTLRKVRTITEDGATDQIFDETNELIIKMIANGTKIPIPNLEEWELK